MRDQHARAAGREEAFKLFAAAVLTGTFDHQTDAAPIHFFRGRGVGHHDSAPVDDERVVKGFDRAGKAAVGGVEAGEIDDTAKIRRFVDRDDLKPLGESGFDERAQKTAADTTVTVDGETKGALWHRRSDPGRLLFCRRRAGPELQSSIVTFAVRAASVPFRSARLWR